MLGVADGRSNLGILLDRVPDLLVKNSPVGDHDDRVKGRRVVLFYANKLVGQPGDGIRLAAAGRVLNQVSLAGPVLASVGEQLPNHIKLVVPRPDLRLLFPARLLVLLLDDLGVVLKNVGQAVAGQDFFPEVVGLQPIRVGRVACAVVPAAVEGQKP